ncbi:MAG: type II secretion system protein, partial [Litorilituus sp.]|nr:type II secretion system protein [Litorilituus sp.]
KNAGFTLLELVVVVAIMGLISTMAMDVYTDNSNQKRFEATKQRLAEIKFAIIGDPMMRVGSQVILEGSFFKDMERLPRNLNELIVSNLEDLCIDENYIATASTQVACDPANTWVEADSDDDDINDLWNGPYLHNIQAVNNVQVFRDAWGNSSDDDNFGWIFTPGDLGLAVQTKGLNREAVDDENFNQYELVYPSAANLNLINKAELDRIMQLKGLAATGYCVVLAESTIDLNFITQSLCEANNLVLPSPPPTHLWASFI